jgi:hypothetical protein
MPRPCGPCSDKRRNELDRRLLEMDISGETFRGISREFGYSEDALSRHKANHLTLDIGAVKAAMEQARERELEKVRQKELEDIKDEAANSMAAKLENAASFFDQLREVRRKAANLLDQAEKAKDLKAAGVFIRELREEIRLWAELEGKLAAQPQITIINHPEWVELRTVILTALDPYPEAKEAIVNAIRGR